METIFCIFLIATTIVFFGAGCVGIYSLFGIARRVAYVRREIEHAKISLKKTLIKQRMLGKLTRNEYECFEGIINDFNNE